MINRCVFILKKPNQVGLTVTVLALISTNHRKFDYLMFNDRWWWSHPKTNIIIICNLSVQNSLDEYGFGNWHYTFKLTYKSNVVSLWMTCWVWFNVGIKTTNNPKKHINYLMRVVILFSCMEEGYLACSILNWLFEDILLKVLNDIL